VIDVVAGAVGHAALGRVTDIWLDPEANTFRYSYGYQWRNGTDIYGGLLQKAACVKVAALVRGRVGAGAPGTAEDNPLMEQYRLREGYYHEAGMALAVDILSRSVGMRPDGPGAFTYVWEFVKRGGDEAARDELAAG